MAATEDLKGSGTADDELLSLLLREELTKCIEGILAELTSFDSTPDNPVTSRLEVSLKYHALEGHAHGKCG